jgi:4-alpha-glucanotransferase
MSDVIERARAWGVEPGYHAINGEWVKTSPQTAELLLAAMRADGPEPPPSPTLVHEAGSALPLDEPHEIETEDGAVLPASRTVPPDLSAGYHTLRRLRDGQTTALVLAPDTCHLPSELRCWAWAAQLYAARSGASWGMGDLGDLRQLAGWARGQGAGTLLINPLHAPLPLPDQQPSPYFPSSRIYRNPLYLRIDEVPGAGSLGSDLEPLASAGRALNGERHIDRDRVFALKLHALEKLFAGFSDDPDFTGYRQAEGQPLVDYATFCVLSENHGAPWTGWPEALRHPRSEEVRRVQDRDRHRVRFHQWLQWLLDRQLGAAASVLPPLHDLAVGVDGAGADAWLWQECLARDVTVGAPPDPFAPKGQDWAVVAFDPWRLRQARYEPFVRTVRAAFRHGMGLRVDHVMGLFRLFWVPAGVGASSGAYVRYPYRDLLGILALESQRARAVVVGEDLGTVEDWVRDELSRRSVLSYRLMWFEDRPPAEYPRDALAALTTHDLPTLAGVWLRQDGDEAMRERLRRYGGVQEGASVEEAAEAVYGALAASPSRVVAATLEDALGVIERPNLPGTQDPRNWSLALPVPLEQLVREPTPERLARQIRRFRPVTGGQRG